MGIGQKALRIESAVSFKGQQMREYVSSLPSVDALQPIHYPTVCMCSFTSTN